MKFLVCPDSFKGSIDAKGAAEAISGGILFSLPGAELISLPVADGGEGTLKTMVPEANRIFVTVTGTNRRPVLAEYGYLGDCAIIEMAQAAGLLLVPESDRNPMTATTFGVGELIRDALDRGFRKILLAIGGSGTDDGGTGLFTALGGGLFDANGHPLTGCGADLARIARIDPATLDKRLSACEITVAADVNNPLCGDNGATMIYAPQKGATSEMLLQLEAGMQSYAHLLDRTCGHPVSELPGSGAAGGVAVPLLAFFRDRVTLKSGIDCVLDACGFDSLLDGCHAVITGEGRTDAQSANGKVLSGITRHAKEKQVPVYVLSGCTGVGFEKLYDLGVREIRTLVGTGCSGDYAMTHANELLFRVAAELAASL